jgi:hypothetical protein
MPQSVYQTALKNGLIQAEFHSKSDRLLLLSKSGELICKTLTGEDAWNVRLECDPYGFAINAEGDQIAVLGEEVLIFYQVWTGSINTVAVDKKNRLVEAYKNCVLVSGYHELITMVTPGGKVINSLASDGLIRQMKVIPRLEQIMIYSEDKMLQCFDMSGEIQWELDKTILTGNFVVSADGEVGYFIRYPNELIKFSLIQDDFFRVENEFPPKLLDLTADGNFLLVLDSENRLTLHGRDAQPIMRQKLDHSIQQIRLSPCGDHFLTVDQVGVLNCFVANEAAHDTGDFFEFNDSKRVEEKEALWSLQPGLYQKVQGFDLLTLNPSRSHIALIGLDGQVYFVDESGQFSSKIRAPFRAEVIGMNTGMELGYIYGDKQILLMDFTKQTTGFILLKASLLATPVVNFWSQQVVILTDDVQLIRYSFSGEQLGSVPLKKEYRKGLSCDAFGMVLFNDYELAGLSNEGQVVFKISLAAPILSIDWVDEHVIGATKDNQLFSVNLSSAKPQKGKFRKLSRPFRFAAAQPFLIIEEDERLHHLDLDLASISQHSIQSKDSRFMVEDGNVFEIAKRDDGLFCMDDRQQMIWRVCSADPITDFALTRNGLIMVTEDNLHYVEIKTRNGQTTQRSDYLEI